MGQQEGDRPTMSFKEKNSFEKRLDVSSKIRKQYADRIPVIVEKAAGSRISDITKQKFLAPADITVAKFITEIRKHVKLTADQNIFIFISDNVMPQPASTMGQLYAKHKDEDGFLYVVYSGENTFGCL
eukprot:TRINITY_DN6789_c0_g1_i1.p1 TRINITY_DN6789_c0_g1~~TRINITY_DN6789_c0_g1_i1.p1  ORF type:complete len:128 (-),score=3.55 TRINITY_DN6789_c0_g1_i1:49-432(-)